MRAAAVLPILLLLGEPSGAPTARAAQAPAAQRDSAAVLHNARRAQVRFEIIRRNNLSFTWDRGSAPCDERVGRFCLYYGSDDDTDGWTPPAEPEVIRDARAALLDVLARAGARVPGDDWIAGQHVRYLLEHGEAEAALAVARACRAEGWWCQALRGMALHDADRTAEAEAAFDSALAAMPAAERRRWTDLAPVLDPGEVRGYRRGSDAERAAREERFWWLADPLWLRAGNDRRTEHFARRTMEQLQDRARTPEGIVWGSDLRELLVRYGSPIGWERVRSSWTTLEAGNPLISHYAPRSRNFLPPLRVADEYAALAPDSWRLKERGSRTAYTPAYVHRFRIDPLDHRVSVFRRGDSIVAVAQLGFERDSALADRPVAAALVAAAGPAAPLARADTASVGEHALFSVRLPTAPAVLSLEAIADTLWAGRARLAIDPRPLVPGLPALSDLLLIEPGDSLPATLEAAKRVARPRFRERAGEEIGVFFEVYGIEAPRLQAATVAVSLRRTDASWLRRAAQRVRLVGVETPIRLRWEEIAEPDDGIYARAVTLRLPDGLTAGDYAIELSVSLPGREALRATRALRVD